MLEVKANQHLKNILSFVKTKLTENIVELQRTKRITLSEDDLRKVIAIMDMTVDQSGSVASKEMSSLTKEIEKELMQANKKK